MDTFHVQKTKVEAWQVAIARHCEWRPRDVAPVALATIRQPTEFNNARFRFHMCRLVSKAKRLEGNWSRKLRCRPNHFQLRIWREVFSAIYGKPMYQPTEFQRNRSTHRWVDSTNITGPFLRGLAMRIMSVCLSVCQTCELWQNGRKISPDFLYHTKVHLSYFSERKNGWWGRPLLPEILSQPTPVGATHLGFPTYVWQLSIALTVTDI